VVGADIHARSSIARIGDQVLIGAVSSPGTGDPKDDVVAGGNRKIRTHGFDPTQQLILDDERLRLAVLDDIADFRSDQPEVNRHGDKSRHRSGGVDFEPLQAIVRKDADTVAPCEPQARERIGEPAKTLLPHTKTY